MKINRFYYATIVTIFLLILVSVDMITEIVFVNVFIPLSIWMLFIGIAEFKKTFKIK